MKIYVERFMPMERTIQYKAGQLDASNKTIFNFTISTGTN